MCLLSKSEKKILDNFDNNLLELRSNVYKPLVLSLATGKIYEALTSNSKLPLLLLGLHVISDCSKTFF